MERAEDLARQLVEARDARELTRLLQRVRRVNVLNIDELGFVSFDRASGELLFNLQTDRYEWRAGCHLIAFCSSTNDTRHA